MTKKASIIVLSFLVPYYLFTHPFLIIANDLGTSESTIQEGFLYYWSMGDHNLFGLFLQIRCFSIFTITIVVVEYYTKLKWRPLYWLQGLGFLFLMVFTYHFLNDVPWVRLLAGGHTKFIKLPVYYFILTLELLACVFSLVKGIAPNQKSKFLSIIFD
ncbi:MAG: hypothetical protein JKY52_17930 [Flavobacteriales bacterium]|nr:hypothetical protein [Flavobacteriales bacterium]